MTINIINEPYTGYEYEFTVAAPLYGDDYLFIGHFENGYMAERAALETGGIILHNIRIQGKKDLRE